MKIILIVSALALTGCSSSQPVLSGQLDPTFGNAVTANINAQFVRPTQKQKLDTYIPADPTAQARARNAYREGAVKEPERPNK